MDNVRPLGKVILPNLLAKRRNLSPARISSRVPLRDDAFNPGIFVAAFGQQDDLKCRLGRKYAHHLVNRRGKPPEAENGEALGGGILLFQHGPHERVSEVHLGSIRFDAATQPAGYLRFGGQTAELDEALAVMPVSPINAPHSPRFLHSFQGPLLEQLPAADGAEELYIATPYFGDSLQGLDLLTQRYPLGLLMRPRQ